MSKFLDNCQFLSEEDTSKYLNFIYYSYEVKKRLIEGNIYLVAEIISEMFADYYDKEELASVGYITLVEFFDNVPKSDNIIEWLKIEIYTKILEFINSKEDTLSLNEITTSYDIKDKSVKDQIAMFLNSLDERQRAFMKMYFGYGCKCFSMQDIADCFNVSKAYVSKKINESLKELKNILISNGYRRIIVGAKNKSVLKYMDNLLPRYKVIVLLKLLIARSISFEEVLENLDISKRKLLSYINYSLVHIDESLYYQIKEFLDEQKVIGA